MSLSVNDFTLIESVEYTLKYKLKIILFPSSFPSEWVLVVTWFLQSPLYPHHHLCSDHICVLP